MKPIFLKTLLIINLLFIYNCKAQTTNDYINFYNTLVPKLNSIAPNKTQFYGQSFFNFYGELQNKNINVVGWIHDTKTSPSNKYYKLKLFFFDINMIGLASKNSFQYPRVIVTFENEIPAEVENLVHQYGATWNPTIAQFFSNLKIEKIDFIGVKGYNNNDYSE